jgi:hypothetical protein
MEHLKSYKAPQSGRRSDNQIFSYQFTNAAALPNKMAATSYRHFVAQHEDNRMKAAGV